MITHKKEVHFFYFSPLFGKKRKISAPHPPPPTPSQSRTHCTVLFLVFISKSKNLHPYLKSQSCKQQAGLEGYSSSLQLAKPFHRHEIHKSLMLRYSQRGHYRDLWTSRSQEKLSHTSPGVSLSFSSQAQLPWPLSPHDHLFCTSEQTAQFVCYFSTNRSPFLPDSQCLFLFTFKGSDHHHFLKCIRFPA